jgi:hypothetical protein
VSGIKSAVASAQQQRSSPSGCCATILGRYTWCYFCSSRFVMAVKSSFECEKNFRIGGSSMLAQRRLGKKDSEKNRGKLDLAATLNLHVA